MVHFYRVQRQPELPGRAAFFLPAPKAPPWTDGPAPPLAHHWAGAGRVHQAPGPHSRDRQRTLAATSGAPPSHTRPSHERQTVACHLRAAPYLRLSSVTIPLRDQTTLCGFPAIIWLARPTLLLALARRHNQPLILQIFHFSQAPSSPASRRPWRGGSPDAARQPHILWSVSGPQESGLAPPDHSRLND